MQKDYKKIERIAIMLAVIGGTGFYSLGKEIESRDIVTPYGVATLHMVSIAGTNIVFIPRHGKGHTVAPHKVNYRANIAALEKIGVTGVLSFYASGIISKYKPGDLILIDDFIGLWTPATFYDDFSAGMKHVDFTKPFSDEMKKILQEVAAVNKLKLKKAGIMAATRGPRFETRAEIKFLKKTGANLVNMTAGYEMALLGESEIDFAAIAVASNYAAGISKKPLTAEETLEVMAKSNGKLLTLVQGFVKEII
ncbi:MTAP family purine nucleoside phosphorylase [Candidatus Micrarchaeota archaeon]|nr:MTAP family purine nucleoside phosphorylase [Candidatus Micrarchaeota archaeon]